MSLIEFLKSFIDPQNGDKRKQDVILERCLNASNLELEQLSSLLKSSPDKCLPTLKTFISNLRNEISQATLRIKKQNTVLPNFTSELITIVIMRNLYHSSIPGFRELLHECIELFWSVDYKFEQVMKDVFSEILNVHGVLGVLVSSDPGHLCLNRILFEFKMFNRIERKELLRAGNVVAALVEKCSEHEKISNDFLESLSKHKACTALLKILKSQRDGSGMHQILMSLSIENEQHFKLLKMTVPRRTSDLPHLLQALENMKIDLFRHLVEFSPCTRCHRQALFELSPDKYFSDEESIPSFCLPFEFNYNDRLGLWDVLISDDTIDDMRSLDSDEIDAVIDKLVHLSYGKWGKHQLQRIAWDKYNLQYEVQTNAIPVYEVEVELPDNDSLKILKILWSVDYGFSIRTYSLTQLIKVWAVTTDLEKINRILENLSIVHQVYTSKQSNWCIVRQLGIDDKICPMNFGDEEEAKSSENSLYNKINEQKIDPDINDKRLLEVHKMFVTNKFYPLSKNLFTSLILSGQKFTFQISKKEYDIIRSRKSTIIIGRSGTGKTTCIVFRQITSHLNNQFCEPLCDRDRNFRKRQIFITASPELCDKVKKYFYKLKKSVKLSKKRLTKEQYDKYKKQREEGNLPEETDEHHDVPDSFRDLEDHHFPLFITYNEFSEMLLETYDIKIKNSTFINYNIFYDKYWPRLHGNFDCGLVYSEFSIIKGSDPKIDCLSREEYKGMSEKKYPAFRHNRDQIYDLFEEYEKLKKQNGQYDLMDRTLNILRYAKAKALGGPKIHEVYIDECQDNQIIDLALVLKVFDHADSYFFAGDIAQCIARGSSFRFEDLSALIYKWGPTYNQQNIKPNKFELNINYRCHNGILQLASSVIDLIWKFFPDSIDKLPREIGEVDGPRPVIVDNFQREHFEIFHKNKGANNNVEFGANQIIIVHDDETKSYIENLIDDAGMVSTIFEAKGMEFNDVVLYNFFTDSLAGLKWRVILSELSEKPKGIQTFSHERHHILSSELKHLYVAITRAKQRILICDENNESNMPIRTYWEHLGLITVKPSGYDIFATFADQSDPDEWNKRGDEFMEDKQYKQAMFCFKKSENKRRYKRANAHYLLQIARESREDSDYKTIKSNFISAAQAFKECSLPELAASCYQEINMIEQAAEVYVEWKMFEPAARCYLKIKKWNEAGRYFEMAEKYTDAAFAYLDGDLYDISANLLEKYKQTFDENMYHRIADFIKVHYRETAILYGNFEDAVNIFIRLIYNDEDVIEALQFLLNICGIKVLKTTTENINLTGLQRLLSKTSEIIANVKSESTTESEQWNSLIEKYQLYLAYLEKNSHAIHDCIQYFKCHKEPVNEFHAIIIWLYFTPSNIQVEYWYKRMQYLLRLCELAFPFINSQFNITNKDIENIFFINEVNDDSSKRQIPFGNLLLNKMKTKNDQYIYDKNEIYNIISQFLASYIFKLIQNTNQRGRDILYISSRICDDFVSCKKQKCKNHHVIPTPLILYQRLDLACLQLSVIQQLDVLCHSKLLKNDQINEAFDIQRWWTEKLVEIHFRHQSPQTSCPEITYTVLAKLSKHNRDGFINLIYKTWSLDGSKNDNDIETILKCIFVFQQLQNEKRINKFYLELSKMTMFSNPINVPVDPVISLGKRLSIFFYFLNSNQVIHAIPHMRKIIQSVIDNIQLGNLITFNTFGDLVSLMEFLISLVLTTGSEYCDLCLPRAYLVNYFEAFTTKPLTSNKNSYNNEDYFAAINYSFDQVQQLLDLLICKNGYSTIVLRLIRVLILIVLNEPKFASKVINLLKDLSNKFSFIETDEDFYLVEHLNNYDSSIERDDIKIKKYLKGRHTEDKDIERRNMEVKDIDMEGKIMEEDIEYLVNILNNDLKETGCDSLVIIHHYQNYSSRLSDLEKYGITNLTYYSIEGFHSALQQVILSEITEDNTASEEVQELVTEIHAWFHRKVAEKIQTWYRRFYNRKKFRENHPFLNMIYDNVADFCQIIMESKGRDAVYKYNILLRGRTVDMIVNLINLRDEMDKTMKNLQKSIDNCSPDSDKLEQCLKLKDDLRCHHYENINAALESLSVIENAVKHEETNVEWLEDELDQAQVVTNQVLKWIDECKESIKL